MKYLYFAFFVCLSTITFAQQNSPYSRFGIGQLQPKEQTHLRAMGYISSAYVDSVATNFANSASLSAKELASLDISFNVNYRSLQDQDDTSNITEGEVNYLAYSFPVNKSKTWGMAIGAQTIASKKYDVKGDIVNNTYFTDFEGDGDSYKLFLQNGVELTENFSIGLDAGVFFANLDDETFNNFLQVSANGTGERTRQKLRGAMFNIGTQYNHEINEDLDITFGATYQLETKLNNTITKDNFKFIITSFDRLENGYIDILGRNEFDNVTTEEEADFDLPSSGSFGVFLRKPQKWSFGIDSKFGLWEDFSPATGNSTALEYRNTFDIAAGGSFIPKYRNPDNFFDSFEYRYGGYYRQTPLTINNSNINDYGLTLGASIPVKRNVPGQRVRQIPSSIDIALNVGQMGTIENNNVQDSYIKGSFAFNLNDVWFQKKKYD